MNGDVKDGPKGAIRVPKVAKKQFSHNLRHFSPKCQEKTASNGKRELLAVQRRFFGREEAHIFAKTAATDCVGAVGVSNF